MVKLNFLPNACSDVNHIWKLWAFDDRLPSLCGYFIYSPALKKWGYTGFAMSFRDSVILWFRNCKIKMYFA